MKSWHPELDGSLLGNKQTRNISRSPTKTMQSSKSENSLITWIFFISFQGLHTTALSQPWVCCSSARATHDTPKRSTNAWWAASTEMVSVLNSHHCLVIGSHDPPENLCLGSVCSWAVGKVLAKDQRLTTKDSRYEASTFKISHLLLTRNHNPYFRLDNHPTTLATIKQHQKPSPKRSQITSKDNHQIKFPSNLIYYISFCFFSNVHQTLQLSSPGCASHVALPPATGEVASARPRENRRPARAKIRKAGATGAAGFRRLPYLVCHKLLRKRPIKCVYSYDCS